MSNGSVPERRVVTGRHIERTRQRVTTGQIHGGGRRGLQHPLGMPKIVVHRLGQHRLDPFVGFVAGELFAARRQHRQLRFALLVKPLAVDETIRATADFGTDLGADVAVGRLDLLDFLLRRAVPDSSSRSSASIIDDLPISLAPHTTTTPWSGNSISRCAMPR